MENFDMEQFSSELKQYDSTLTLLKSQCSEAEKKALIAETKLKTLEERYEKLVSDCEEFAGCSLNEIPQLLANERTTLTNLMSQLSSIDVTQPITDDTVSKIQNIVAQYNTNNITS